MSHLVRGAEQIHRHTEEIGVVEVEPQMPAQSESFLSSFGPGRKQMPFATSGAEMSRSSALVPYRVGDLIGGEYEISQILGGPGRSGMGIVYVVYSGRDRMVYALKTFQDKFLASDSQRHSFMQEALTWTRLDHHPNIVRAFSVREFSDRLYILLEYVTPDTRGRNCLTHYLAGAPLSVSQTIGWAVACCRGMEHAVNKGVTCHRDIKPDNLMVTSDRILKITDFGMATVADGNVVSELSLGPLGRFFRAPAGKDIVCGTPGYIAPEVVRGDGATIRSDVFSFGVVLYQMITGVRESPFTHSPEVSARNLTLPTAHPLEPIVRCCLAPSPADRYSDFSWLRKDLEELTTDTEREQIPDAVAESPDLSLWNGKGNALLALKRTDDALLCYDRALELNQRQPEILANKADALRHLGRIQDAIACCDEAIQMDPRSFHAWHSKGSALAVGQRWKEALDCFDYELELLSQDANSRKEGAELYGRLIGRGVHEPEDLQRVVAECNTGLEATPNNPYLWYEKGVALRALGHNSDALQCVAHAARLSPGFHSAQLDLLFEFDGTSAPKYAEIWMNRAIVLENLDRLDEALSSFDKCLEIDPHCADALYLKGNIHLEKQQLLEALSCYERALGINPKHLQAWNQKGKVLYKLSRPDDVIPCFQRALEIDPNDSETAFNMGVALYFGGPPKEAIAWLDRAIQLDPTHAAAWFSKGNALLSLGRPTDALGCYDRALQLKPEYFEAWGNKGQALATLKRPAEAIECFDRTLRLRPDLPGIWVTKGDMHAQLSQYDDALQAFNRAIEIDSVHLGAWCAKAVTLADAGRVSEAQQTYRKAIAIAPNDMIVYRQWLQNKLRDLENTRR